MPHNNLNKHVRLSETTEFSAEIGVTYEEARENLLYAPLFAVGLRYAPTVSLSFFFLTRPLVLVNIGRLPYTSVCMARKSVLPEMPHVILSRVFIITAPGLVSSAIGTVRPESILSSPSDPAPSVILALEYLISIGP